MYYRCVGKLEEISRRKARRGEIQKLVLESIKLAGILSIGLVAPNVISTMSKLGIISNSRQSEVVRSSASKLAKKGLLKYENNKYLLTEEGAQKLRQWELRDYELMRQEKWDKKWRVIIFDIPERKRRVRDQIRNLFILSGMYRLQDSVWVYPYDCEDIIGLLKTDFGIGRDLLYIIADEIENDKHLRDYFSLL